MEHLCLFPDLAAPLPEASSSPRTAPKPPNPAESFFFLTNPAESWSRLTLSEIQYLGRQVPPASSARKGEFFYIFVDAVLDLLVPLAAVLAALGAALPCVASDKIFDFLS